MRSTIWVFDSSSLIAIKSLPRQQRDQVFDALATLAADGRLKFPKTVVDELGKRDDAVRQWAVDNRRAAQFDGPFDELKSVLAEVPTVLDPRKDIGVDEADPYVLAVALHLQKTYADVRIVTEERKDSPDKTSLSTAAGMLGIASVPLRGFLRTERII